MASSVIYCTHCGAQNLLHHTFCFACGTALPGQVQNGASASTATGRLPAHTLLKQRYRILHTVGKGGMGAVYAAQDTQLGDRLVAIKEMSQSGLNVQEVQDASENFKQEAHLLAGLHHPHLPSIHDYFGESGRWYLVMSFIKGETLEEYLSQQPKQSLSSNEVIAIGQQLCDVLNYLHSYQPPIIFRDLKPGNIMRTDTGHIYLIDFGIARLFKPGQAKDTTSYGSAGYSPPEQYGHAQTTERSDIYSLGVTLYVLLSGYRPSRSPFRLPALTTLVPGLPPLLTQLIAQMLELEPGKRPISVQAVLQVLQHIHTSLMSVQPASHMNPTIVQSSPVNAAPTFANTVPNNPGGASHAPIHSVPVQPASHMNPAMVQPSPVNAVPTSANTMPNNPDEAPDEPIDGEEVLKIVRSGVIPSTWKIFNAQKRTKGQIYGRSSLICLIICLALFVPISSSIGGEAEGTALFFGLFILLFAIVASISTATANAVEKKVLVLFPEGFVCGRRDEQQADTIVNFVNVAKMRAVSAKLWIKGKRGLRGFKFSAHHFPSSSVVIMEICDVYQTFKQNKQASNP